MKIDFKKVYQDRITEIDIQVKKAIRFKRWGIKTSLECEKKKILGTLKIMDDRECIR